MTPELSPMTLSSRHKTYALLLIVAIGFALRIYHIGEQSLWIDEAHVYSRAVLPDLASVIGPTLGHPEPPLHVSLLHFWLKLSDSDTNARLLSVLFGVGTIGLFYQLFTSIFSQTVGLLSAGLLAINPFHVYYSQEARMYSMLLFLFTLSTFLLWKAIEDLKWRNWFTYGAVLVLCGFTHAVTLFLGLAHTFFALLQKNRAAVTVRLVATFAIVTLVMLPVLLGTLTLATGSIPQLDKPVSLLNLGYLFFALSVGFSFGPSIYEIQANTSASAIQPYWVEISLAALIFLIPFSLGLLSSRRTSWTYDRRQWWLMALLFTVPSLGPFGLDMMTSFTVNPRHVIVCLIPFLGFLAVGVQSLGKRLGTLSFLSIVIVSTLSLSDYYWNPRYSKEDARGTAAYLATVADRETPILVISYHDPIHRYLRSFRVYGESGLNGLGLTRSPNLEDDLKSLAGDSQRLFFVDLRSWNFDPEGRIEAACDLLFRRKGERQFHGVRVVEYEQLNSGED